MTKRPVLTDEQQCLIDGAQIRLIEPGERERFDQFIVEQHYLKNAQLVGEQLRYVAEYKGRWVGLMAWSAGAYKLKHREEWIGWTDKQKKRRLPLVVNNSRFLILQGCHVPNLASRLMKLCLQRLSQDWANTYGHEVLMAESFVDPEKHLGTSYWRQRQSDFALSSLITVSLCALLGKVCLGQRDLAAFAADLTVDQMEALHFPRDWTSRQRRYRPPSESTFFRLLSNLNPRQLEKALLEWQDHVLGKRDPVGDPVAVDGKELLNSQGLDDRQRLFGQGRPLARL